VHKIFVDGQVGTTGLQIQGLLSQREDLQLLEIPEIARKDRVLRGKLLNEADLVILCLPDDAARESVALVTNPDVKILDASTAHRINPDWTYGLPELGPEHRKAIQSAQRVANPGCYPTGFLLAVAPLVEAGLIPPDAHLTVNAVSGYSGGGRKMIEDYQQRNATPNANPWSFRPYALNLSHKHLPEMQHFGGLSHPPLFTPSVGNFEQGMLVQIPLFRDLLGKDYHSGMIQEIWFRHFAQEPCVTVHGVNAISQLDQGFLDPETNNHSNRLDLFLFETGLHCLLIARLDNLGKGAAGAAIQNLNLMLGYDELTGLSL
jgi:N-acetyl-gamma-glutamyl-phosphate reductase